MNRIFTAESVNWRLLRRLEPAAMLAGALFIGNRAGHGKYKTVIIVMLLPWLIWVIEQTRPDHLLVFLSVILGLGWVPTAINMPDFWIYDLAFPEAIILFLATQVLARRMLRPYEQTWGRFQAKPFGLLALFALGGLIAVAGTSNPVWAEVMQWRITCLSALIVPWLCMMLIRRLDQAEQVLGAVAISITTFASIALVQRWLGIATQIEGFGGLMRFAVNVELGPFSYWFYPNEMAALAAIAMPIALVFWLSASSRLARTVAMVDTLVLAYTALATGGRASLIGIGASWVVITFLSLLTRISPARVVLIKSGIVMLCLAIGITSLMSVDELTAGRWGVLITGIEEDPNWVARVGKWERSWGNFLRNPWGDGFHTPGANHLLAAFVLVGTGFLGTLALLGLIAFLGWRCWRGLRDSNLRRRRMSIIGMAFLLTFITTGMAGESLLLRFRATGLVWAIVGAILVATWRNGPALPTDAEAGDMLPVALQTDRGNRRE